MGATNDKPELDLSFLDPKLTEMMKEEHQEDLDRIQTALRKAFESIDGEVAYKDFWTGFGVPWRDSRSGVSKLGSLLHKWLAQQGVIEDWDAENHMFDQPPAKTKEFITSTRTVLELGMALGAILATQEKQDGK
jgi:hypothetical protein